MRVTSILTAIVGIVSVLVGLLLSPIPTKLGLYRWIASVNPVYAGLTPAFHYGVPWRYTFEELYGDDCKSIAGQTALVTGANSGVGFETAMALAQCGARVTLACRNAERCQKAADKIKRESTQRAASGAAEISTMTVDTSSLASVKTFSKEFLAKNEGGALDMLFLNAGRGVIFNESSDGSFILSKDGIEIIFATNHLGHHLMYKYLEPLIRNSAMARIVLTSSAASFNTFPHVVATSLEELHGPTISQESEEWYGQSKLAQIVWAKKVTRDLAGSNNSNVFVNAVHPGAVDTAIWDKFQFPDFAMGIVNYFRKGSFWTAKEGALTMLFLGVATDRLRGENIRGKYYHPQAQEVVNPMALDEKLQDDLWEFSDLLVADFVAAGGDESKDKASDAISEE